MGRLMHFGRAGVVLVLLALFAPMARADAATQFPDVAQVAADYPDPAKQYMALSFLWDYLHAKAAASPDALEKRKTYYAAMQDLRFHYSGGIGAFDERVEQVRTRDFGREVLARYHVMAVQADAPPLVAHDVTDAMIQGAFMKASPLVIAGLFAMWLAMKLVIRWTSVKPGIEGPAAAGVVPLPAELRTVRLPGVRFPVTHLAGLVMDKESEVRTQHTTTTTAERDPFHLGPGPAPVQFRTNTSSTSTRVDTLWVRQPDGSEAAWTLTQSGFQARAGHVISAIAKTLRDGSRQFLALYNHATGQLEVLGDGGPGCKAAVLAWILGPAVGSVFFGLAIAIFLSVDPSPDPDPLHAMFLPVAYWIEGGMAAGFLGIFMVLWMLGSATRARAAAFQRHYVPAYRQFFQQTSASLRQMFGA